MDSLAPKKTKSGRDAAPLAPWSCDDGTIRVTPEGQPSVFDMIKVLGGQKDPHKVWSRLTESHPEVRTKCRNLKFPGPGQRETPVAKDKESAYYILGLLPGTVGKKYREDAAKLFITFLEEPAKIVAAAAERLTPEESGWLEARLNAVRTRFSFTDTLKEHGVSNVGYARCTNAVYGPVFGADARTLKEAIAEDTGLPLSRINPRDHMDIRELNDLEFAERVAAGQLKRSNAQGNTQSEYVVRTSAEYARKLLDGEITIPGL